MRHIHFSVSTVLVGMAALGLGLGALESRAPAMANLVFTVQLALLGVGLVGAIATRGNRRVFWLGFATFSWTYSLVAFGILFPGTAYNSGIWWSYPVAVDHRPTELITSDLLDWYGSLRVRRQVGNRVSAQWSGGGYWPATIRKIHGGQFLVAWDDGSPAEWVGAAQVQPTGRDLQRVGHALFSPLFGLLGGAICWYCFADRRAAQSSRRTEPQHDEAS
jgi:hypothetical protein